MKNLILIIVISLSLFGCVSTHSGIFKPSDVQLNNPNFRIIKTIDGFASATYIFGIGGYNREGLIKEAKTLMYKKHKFEKSQTITNITLDEKRTWILAPIIYTNTVYISADIVQFGDELQTALSQDESEPIENQSVPKEKNDRLKIGDTIYFKDNAMDNFIESKVIKMGYPVITVSYSDKGKTIKTKKKFSDLYLKEGDNYRQLEAGK
jgi:predicted RecA/RadA family phage recombinase